MEKKLADLISQLKDTSPMPDDAKLTKDIVERYDVVISKMAALKDTKFIVPLIDSFGYGDGFGTYWKVLHLLEEFEVEKVDPILIERLVTGTKGTKMWAAYMLGRSKNLNAVDSLILLLKDENDLIRHNAVMALGMIGDKKAKSFLEKMKNDSSQEVRIAVERALKSLSGSS